MKSYRWTCCERIDFPENTDYHGEIVVIEGLITPSIEANGRGEALAKLSEWFIQHKCRPYRELV